MLFSANLGFLWTDRPLIDAVYAAKKAGFDAVECHWPYDTDPKHLAQALQETELPMLGLNTIRGDVDAGENGLSALPGREAEAIQAIDQAIAYASQIGCKNIHVMAGFSQQAEALTTFTENLEYACEAAKQHQLQVLIEPLNQYDAPNYFLNSLPLARQIIEQLNQDNLKLMFDCYHLQILHGDITRQLSGAMDIIGHIQFASVPDRSEPSVGELNYHHIFTAIKNLGYNAPLGAEYKPSSGNTDASLDWLADFKAL